MSDTEAEDVDTWIDKGHELSKLEKYEEALRAFDKTLEINPENVVAWIFKGISLCNLEKDEESLEAFNRALNIDPKNSFALLIKGVTLNNLKKSKEALEVFNETLETDPKNIDAWRGKGSLLSILDRYEEALEVFNRALDIDSENAEIWRQKGLALYYLYKHEESLEAFNRALDIDSENSFVWLAKGDLFSSLGIYDNALKNYIKAISIDPKISLAWTNKAAILFNLKKYAECKEALEQALKLDPNDIDIYNNLAEYYLFFGDLKNASIYVKKALLIDKEDAFSLGLKGKIKIEEQDYSASTRCFKKAISSDLRNPVYLLWDTYAKYLMAELEFASDEKKYQDMILAIIRELEKVDKCNPLECNNGFKTISCWFLKFSTNWFKNLATYILKFIKGALIFLDISEELTVKLLEVINPPLIKLESTKIIAYNYYFLGCFYYKINDYFTAVEYLKKCNHSNPDSTIRKSCREILNSIWNNKIRPSIWSWWLYSPLNCWFKRVSFLVLILSLFGILLPTQADALYGTSFFSSINWKDNTIPLTFLTLIILYILASPNIQHFKGSQIEIEVRPPPAFELTPSLIEKKLKDLESVSRSQ